MLLQTPSSIVPCRGSRTGRLGTTFLVASLVALGAMACDKVPLTAPAGTVITLVSSTNVLPINGSTEVIAVLIENGTTGTGTGTGTGGSSSAGTPVHNGTLVTFTTSLGRIEPAEAHTVNGRVSVVLLADGRSGTATITAFSGSASETLEVKIGATEFRLLHFFMTHPERVHSRAQLLDRVWGDHVFIEERTVDVHVKRLRESLSGVDCQHMIETVRGAGYRLTHPQAAAA